MITFDINAITQLIISRIIQNTSKGIDSKGIAFKQYSFKPFGLPAAAFFKFIGVTALKRLNKNDYSYYKKNGSLWILIKGGYLQLKRARFKTGETTPNLQVIGMRGGMLGSLTYKVQNANTSIIQFSNQRASTLAYYHNEVGAGKSKVIRHFLGLPDKDIKELKQHIIKDMIIEIADKKVKV